MEEKAWVNRTISLLSRMSHMYFDRQLEPYQIGCGQQFFLLHIYHHPGISLWEVAQYGSYDKGTTTRAVRRLEETGFITRTIDERDKRYHRLYPTKKAEEVMPVIKRTVVNWNSIITEGLDEQQYEQLMNLLDQLANNASKEVLKDRRRV